MMTRLCCVNKSERDLNYKHFDISFCGLATSWFFLLAALRGILLNLKNIGPDQDHFQVTESGALVRDHD